MTEDIKQKDATHDEKEKMLGRELANPSFDPDTDNKTDLVGLDVTEPGGADISKTARTSLGIYLGSYVRWGRRQVKPGNTFYPTWERSSVAQSHNRGDKLTPPPSQAEGTFYQQDESQLLTTTDFFEPKDQLAKLIDKTGKDVSLPDSRPGGSGDPGRESGKDVYSSLSGQTLLKEISEKGPGERGSPAKLTDRGKKYQKFLLENLVKANLYHPPPNSPFIENKGTTNEEEMMKGLFTIQRDLGSFKKDGIHVKVSDMSKIALGLLAQSAGERDMASWVLAGDFDLDFLSQNILHTTEQLGIKGVPVHRLRIKNLIVAKERLQKIVQAARGNDDIIGTLSQNSLNDRGITGAGSDNYQSSPMNSVSYAQLNSFLEPFGSLGGSGGMLAIALEGVLALMATSLLISGIDALFNIGSPSFASDAGRGDDGWVNPNKPWQYELGSHRGEGAGNDVKSVLKKLLRITATDYDFENCVANGIMLLMGFDRNVTSQAGLLGLAGITAANVAAFALNLALSPSYYANLFRQIVRDTNEITAKFKEIGGSFTSGITSIVALVEKLTSSKAYQFIMIAAGIGDADLKSVYGQLDVGDENKLLDVEINPTAVATATNPNDIKVGIHRQKISRWEGGRNPLSLHTFLASNFRSKLRQTETQNGSSIRKTGSSIRKKYVPAPGSVRKIERDLEAEYMPFYFHDLRTHEVLSLPAFVTQFSENFAVNHTSNNGYGRQDAVRTYESTERSMSFAFKLVSFNKADFDEMWLLVNKLVAMCYPQYSKGRKRQYKQDATTYQFTQPFSQTPAASPVIRLRFGDVLKSNYSKESLKKQFGDMIDVDVDNERREYRNAVNDYVSDFKRKFENNKFTMASSYGKLSGPEDKWKLVGVSRVGRKKTKSWPAGSRVEILSQTILGIAQVRGENDTVPTTIDIVSDGSIEFDVTRLSDSQINADPVVLQKKSALDAKLKGKELTAAQMTDFFKPENNAIVRSFNSTRGKGLAGVITSLAFDYGNYPYETTLGSRAPKMIDVSLGFAPIHDLPLGLDYNGEMRAPSHPVGGTMKGFGAVYSDEEIKKKTPG